MTESGPTLDLLTMGRLFSIELPDGRGPVTVVADHVQSNGDVLMDGDRPLGKVWEVDLACADAEAAAVPLGLVRPPGQLLTSNGWATVLRVDVRLGWVLEREDGRWPRHPRRTGGVTLALLFVHARPCPGETSP